MRANLWPTLIPPLFIAAGALLLTPLLLIHYPTKNTDGLVEWAYTIQIMATVSLLFIPLLAALLNRLINKLELTMWRISGWAVKSLSAGVIIMNVHSIYTLLAWQVNGISISMTLLGIPTILYLLFLINQTHKEMEEKKATLTEQEQRLQKF